MEPESTEALDLSMPKLPRPLSPDHSSSVERPPGHSQSAHSKSGDTQITCNRQGLPFPEEELQGHFRSRKEREQLSENYYMKNEDYTPPSKKHKISLTPYEGYSPPAAYIARTAEANDACLRDDADSPPSTPFMDAKLQDVGEIKRTCQGISVSLHDENLWRAFAKFGTEMIINRGGRRMFPHIILSLEGMDPQRLYTVTLEIVPADGRRYKFIHNQWMPMGMADPGPGIQPVIHPDSPNVGSFWMRNRASFSKVRLTNNKDSSVKDCSDGTILLLSMHKYKVVIKIKDESSPANGELIFDFDESAFIAVTAYQNSKITQLKIQNNPFAKAFRDCHNPSFMHKGVSPRRRDTKSKNCFVTHSPQTVPVSESQSLFQFHPLPYHQGGFGMATLEMNAWNPAQYFPWAAVGQHWSFPYWAKDTRGLMNSLYSKTLSSVTPEVRCMPFPVEFSRSFSVNSQTSSCSNPDTEEQEEGKETKYVCQN